MNKSEVLEKAKKLSLSTVVSVYVWSKDSGEWDYSSEYPNQYLEIIAEFKNGLEV